MRGTNYGAGHLVIDIEILVKDLIRFIVRYNDDNDDDEILHVALSTS